jgi:hypothetical protein
MRQRTVTAILAIGILLAACVSVSFGMREALRPFEPLGCRRSGPSLAAPCVIVQGGDTAWVQPQANGNYCPGDPLVNNGGEGTGGPVGAQTWCFEPTIPNQLCGSLPPWTVNCFRFVDVRSLPSQTNVNYWHIDGYRTDQKSYTGSRALWCGTDGMWRGKPVECGTWRSSPGYSNQCNCVVQLSLPASFSVAGGCTLWFDPRYDTECKYDYFYIDVWNGAKWTTIATFNGTSNDPGAECGSPTGGNPDYFGNVDTNRFINCNWQVRTFWPPWVWPAFRAVVTPQMLGTVVNAPRFRWRFVSDGAGSDADGAVDTDGGAFIDNVEVYGDLSNNYRQDFEACSIYGPLPQYWSLENPSPVAQGWHLEDDTDPPYEGGDGGTRTSCVLDESWTCRARPAAGFPPGSAQELNSFYRLLSPRVRVAYSGCVVQYDQYMCSRWPLTCDYMDTKVKFYDEVEQEWCPWTNIDGYILYGGCSLWDINRNEDVSRFYSSTAESVQFAWDFMDLSVPGQTCRGRHKDSDDLIDNVSIGFYSRNETIFTARGIDLLHDSFLPQIDQAYNSFFDAYDADSINWYRNSGHTIPRTTQLNIDATDKDGISTVRLWASINKGATWIVKNMTLDIPQDPNNPSLGGKYYANVKASDFSPGVTSWTVGTEIWYFVEVVDNLADNAYFPERADPASPEHTGERGDYFHFAIMPRFPPAYSGPKVLLVDGFGQSAYDWSPCLSSLSEQRPLVDIYKQTLVDAGYCFDEYHIGGAGTGMQIHPMWFSDYDAVVWFTGPYYSTRLFSREAQQALREYLADSGKVVLCGDRIAFDMAPTAQGGNGEDSLNGEFLSGIMGAAYLREMESPFNPGGLPFAYAKSAPTVNVFGTPVAIPLDSMVVYRECPYLKDMSYVQVNPNPPVGYTAQPLLHLKNPIGVAHADEAIYTEYQGVGQCVYVNFDLSASINHKKLFCTGATQPPAPMYPPGNYYGRVELMKVILNNLFGLPPNSGGGGTSDVPTAPKVVYRWALAQNAPNPLADDTEIHFEVASTADVSIKVYNTAGQLVRVLVNERVSPGRGSTHWDGRNLAGEHVAGGVYFFRMEADRFTATKKMVVVK